MSGPAAGRLAQALVRGGVRAIFGVPGSGVSYEIITELQDLGIPYYGASHEGAAAIMAGAFARQSGTVGCAVGIRGPGLANMLPGIVANHLERFPALSMTEAVAPGTGPGRVHKRLDHRGLLASLVKAYATAGDPEGAVAHLLRCAEQEIPGPTHLDLVVGEGPPFAEFLSAGEHLEPPEGGWAELLKLVALSSRPLLIVGSLARRVRWRVRLAALRVPVFTTLSAKGVVDELLPQVAGVFTGDGKAMSPERQLLGEADLVIGLGLRNFEVLKPASIVGPLVMVDCVASGATEGFAAAGAFWNAREDHFEELLGCIASREWGLDVVSSANAELRQRLLEPAWLPAGVFAALEETVPDAVFVADTGSFCTIAEHMWRASKPEGFLCSANGRFMGTSVPMAIGAALAHPERPVICAMGDGGVRAYFAELKLAVERHLSILFLLLSDGRYGSIAAGLPPARRRAAVLSMANPSWFEAARGLGCRADQVGDLAGLAAAVRRWRGADGPCFIEARFDPDAYVAMTQDLR